MIDYETFAKIHDCHDRQGLTIAQTARVLGLHPQTVATWLKRARFEPRRSRPRGSILDPFKPRITRLLDSHPYSAQQILQRLREEGYEGGVTILRDYVRRIRPPKRPVYLKLHFAPGECAQVDWGAYVFPRSPVPVRNIGSGGRPSRRVLPGDLISHIGPDVRFTSRRYRTSVRMCDTLQPVAAARNTAQDWVEVGFDVLAEDGIAGIKIHRMAERLGVTKAASTGTSAT